MIDFHNPEISDKGWIDLKIEQAGFLTCEYTFGNIFSYSAKIDINVAEVAGCLVTRCSADNNYFEYCFPIGNGDTLKALEEIILDGKERGYPFGFFGMNTENAKLLKKYIYPTFLILDAEGNKTGEVIGGEGDVHKFIEKIEKASKGETPEE